MPKFYVDEYVDVDPYEFVDSCSKNEIKTLINVLKDRGCIVGDNINGDKKRITSSEWILIKSLEKILNNTMTLSKSDVETINKIADTI